MADAQTLAFTNYTLARFTALQSVLSAKGLQLEGNVGQVKKFGADVSYAYDGSANLTLVIRSAPHFHNMASFVAELSKAINEVPA